MIDVSTELNASLAWARAAMESAGADSPGLTALVLLEHVTGLRRESVLSHPETRLTQSQLVAFRGLVERRCRREPLAYILGYREFDGRRYAVDGSVLVPRPETEGLVALASARVQDWTRRHSSDRLGPTCLDVGTGSGAIVLGLLARNPRLLGVATDTELPALNVARANADHFGVGARLRLVACNLADAIHHSVPLVIANLPYVPCDEIAQLEPEVREFEPRKALDGGPDGTVVIRELIASLPKLLAPGGAAILEFGHDQAAGLTAAAREAIPESSVGVERDGSGIERYLIVQRPD